MYQGSDVAVCVLFFEKAEQTIECLKSIVPSGVQIYLLDNGSSRESSLAVRGYADTIDSIRWHESTRNLGCAGGRNYLISRSTEPWLFFLDNDAIIHPEGWHDCFQAHVRREPTIEVFSARLFELHYGVYRPNYRLRLEERTAHVEPSASPLSNIFPGGTSFVHRTVFERLGLFDDHLHGWEDWELAIRAEASAKPIRCRMVDDIEVIHDHRPAIHEVDRNGVRVRYDLERIERSLERLIEKHGFSVGGRAADWRAETQEQIDAMLSSEERARLDLRQAG